MLNAVTDDFVAHLRAALPAAVFPKENQSFLEEPRGIYQGHAGLIVAPGTTKEVAAIIGAASEARIPVVPYAGGTGLVGGQISPVGGPLPLVLSTQRMTAIRGVYPRENTIVVEAGTILATVQDAANAAGRLFPLSLASEGSARIGGLLGTNAGGVNVLRYGSARELCLGLEAVLPSGKIWHGLKRLRKDNTGYDLRGLLIGSEGTLGVITAASLRLFPSSSATGAGLLAVKDPNAALELLTMAGETIGAGLSAFELVSGTGLRFIAETMPRMRLPYSDPPDWLVLIDVGLTSDGSPQDMLESLFAEAHEAGIVSDGLVAQSEAQRKEFWAVREAIPEANRHIGSVSSHDISLPLGAIPEFITRGNAVISAIGDFRINCFGHLGDGNLHYNVFPPTGQTAKAPAETKETVRRAVHDLVAELDGSISAEHGIGRLKVKDLVRYGDPTKLEAMRAIKNALDPLGIMNPGAVLSPPSMA